MTILFSDIEDSTLITERLGDQRWLEVLRAHNALFRRLVRSHGGFEVKNQGDGFMLVFPDSGRALECGGDPARALAERPGRGRTGAGADRHARRRGDPRGGDFFGRSVILAAWIAARARGARSSSPSSSRTAPRSSADRPAIAFDRGQEIELKGWRTHRVYRAEEQALGN